MTDVLGYHHLSLSVTDLGKSTEWYQQVLGLDVAAGKVLGGRSTRPSPAVPDPAAQAMRGGCRRQSQWFPL